MDKIPQKHLEFLEFVCNKIYGESPGWWQLNEIAKEFSIQMTLDEVRQYAGLYKGKFFKVSNESDLKIYPKPEIKQEIENHGSFSKYMNYLKHQKKNADIKKLLVNNIGSIVALGLLFFTIWSWQQNKKSNTEIKTLKLKIQSADSVLKNKDSIIFDLKQRLMNDAIKPNH